MTLIRTSLLVAILFVCFAEGAGEAGSRGGAILIVIGPSDHPPGSHEPLAGARLLQYCLERAEAAKGMEVAIREGWPGEPELLERARVVVFMGDGFPPYYLDDSHDVFKALGQMADRGCGIVNLHYATSVNDTADKPVPASVTDALYRWMGGFGHFLPGNAAPGTQARVLEATVEPSAAEHPVTRGVKSFTLVDEPYYPIKFDSERSGGVLTKLAVAMLPPESPAEEVVAWSFEREDGGRSFSVVMPHFFENWRIDGLRKLALNGALWAAGAEIPAEGVSSELPPLEVFEPQAVSSGVAEMSGQPRQR